MDAPNQIEPEQLQELGLKIIEETESEEPK
jgi:hypothetical protein